MLRRRLSTILVSVILACAATAPAVARAGPATDIIEKFNSALLEVMQKADSLQFRGRYETIEPYVRSIFDLDFMARFSVGRHWKTLDEDQRIKLVDAFSRLTIATYADRFNDYSGESFEIGNEEPAPRDTTVVHTSIVKSDGEKIAINYVMLPLKQASNGTGWAIIDIFLKGRFSELAKRRSEFVSVLKREGFDGLLRAIDEKIRQIEQLDK